MQPSASQPSASQPSSVHMRPIPLRMRDDLIVQPRDDGRAVRYVIKDPVAQSYHQLWEQEYMLLRLLDGQRTPLQIKDLFESEFQPARLDLSRLQALHVSFYRSGLVLSLRSGQAESLWSRHLQSKLVRLPRLLASILSFRLRGINPNRFFQQMDGWWGWLHHPACLLLSLSLIAMTLLALLTSGPVVLSKLPQLHDYLTADNFFLAIVTLIGLKLVHELSHGLACKRAGGECNELGIMFLLLAPCLYCDVSDAWLVENKWRRAWIAAAGVWAELTIAAICTWIWWFTYPGLINTLCLNVMLLGGLTSLLFNANPLLRYDGYFVLSDLLDVPNLWERSRIGLKSALVNFFTDSTSSRGDEMPDRPGKGLLAYAVGSLLYQWIVMLIVLVLLYKSLEALRLEALGALLTAALVVVMMVVPAGQHVLRAVSHPRWFRSLRRGRVLGSLGLFGILLAIFCYLPLPCSIRAPFVLSPAGMQQVVSPVEGVLHSCVPEGSSVAAGQVIAQLRLPSVELELANKEGELSRQRAHLKGLEARRGNDPVVPAQITTTQQAISGLQAEVISLKHVLDRMSIRSPIAGVITACERRPVRANFSGIMLTAGDRNSLEQDAIESWTGSPLDRENAGCLLIPGDPICNVAPMAPVTKMEGQLVLTQTQIDWIAVGQSVTARSALVHDMRLVGRVTEISALPTRDLPTIMAHQQLIPHRLSSQGKFESLHPVYRVRVEFETADLPSMDQAIGTATIRVAPRSVGARTWRVICEALGIPNV